MDASRNFGEHERSIRVALGAAESNSSFTTRQRVLSKRPKFIHNSIQATKYRVKADFVCRSLITKLGQFCLGRLLRRDWAKINPKKNLSCSLFIQLANWTPRQTYCLRFHTNQASFSSNWKIKIGRLNKCANKKQRWLPLNYPTDQSVAILVFAKCLSDRIYCIYGSEKVAKRNACVLLVNS